MEAQPFQGEEEGQVVVDLHQEVGVEEGVRDQCQVVVVVVVVVVAAPLRGVGEGEGVVVVQLALALEEEQELEQVLAGQPVPASVVASLLVSVKHKDNLLWHTSEVLDEQCLKALRKDYVQECRVQER